MDSDPEFEVVPGSTHTVGGGAYGLVDRMTVKYKSDQQERQVACKTIAYSETGSQDRSAKKDVEREYMIISTLKHPNIVQYLSIQWHSGSAKLYMEYCEGGSLEDYIKKQKDENQGEKNEGFVWKVVMELASALNYCHHGLRIRTPESGNAIDWDDTMIILHRDIKPGNVFLSSKSEATSTVKLGDFGLGAILRSDGAAPSTYVGTKQYTAPEINRYSEGNITWTDKCDIFSFGC